MTSDAVQAARAAAASSSHTGVPDEAAPPPLGNPERGVRWFLDHPDWAVMRPTRGWGALALGELWTYRELLYFLVWRDVKVRYKQTALGVAWAILQPLLTMVIFSVFFGRLAKVPSNGVPYPIFSFAALVPWTFFSTGLVTAANSLVGNQHLISKVYFPRLAIPIAGVLAGLVDLAIALVVLLGMMAWYGFPPTLGLLWVPALALVATATALGVGCALAALNVQYRDVRFLVPFLAQAWLFATPVAYPATLVPERWRVAYALNPMVGVIEGFRDALLGAGGSTPAILATSVLAALVLLVAGVMYFRRVERTFADVI